MAKIRLMLPKSLQIAKKKGNYMQGFMKCFIGVGSILVCGNAIATDQTKQDTSKAASSISKNTKSSYDTLSFDDSLERLPQHYKGHSIEFFQKTLLNDKIVAKEKTEFETNEAYEERVKDAVELIKFGKSMSINSKWAFMFTPELEYDASLARFSYKFETGAVFALNYAINEKDTSGPLYSAKLPLMQRSSVKGTYIAQNMMGATGRVTRYFDTENAIAITSCQVSKDGFSESFSSPIDPGILGYNYFLSMPPDKAQIQKPHLKFLLIVKHFRAPYAEKKTNHSNPEFPSLNEIISNNSTSFATLQEMWVYNYETGEIIEKVAPCKIQQNLDPAYGKYSPIVNYLF